MMRRLILALTCCWLGIGLAGCDYTLREAAIVAPVDPPGGDPVQEPTDVKYYPSDEPVRMGLEQYNRVITESPTAISRTPWRKRQRTLPPGSDWRRVMTRFAALIWPTKPMRRQFAWGA